jgi:hypothetical protein
MTIPDLLEAYQPKIDTFLRRIANSLAPYEPSTTTYAWFDTLRAIEECINLATVDWDDDAFEAQLFNLQLAGLIHDPRPLLALRPGLIGRFSETFANRFNNLMVQGASIGLAFAAHGFGHVSAGFQSVGTLVGYFQSRRRHFVALLHTLPTACRGSQRVQPLDTLNIFLPVIEMDALQIVGAQQAMLVEAARARLGLQKSVGSELAMLDPLFLEPERSRITEMPMTVEGLAMLGSKEPQPSDRLFSAAELRNDIVAIEAAYAEFDLDKTAFAPAAALMRRLSRNFTERDFWVAITPNQLRKLFDALAVPADLRGALVHGPADYAANLETYSPFVLVDGTYRSTVSLLSRFLYHWRSRCLDRNKRYQIRTGFIFERAVAQELEAQGFAVQEITRINRHEFDVVTLRGGTIWNVQCKNNFVDLEWVESDPQRFGRFNRRLVRAYERALTKERNREEVLKAHLALGSIQHMVLSRFPVVSDNPRMLPFSRIGQFAAAADAIGRGATSAISTGLARCRAR